MLIVNVDGFGHDWMFGGMAHPGLFTLKSEKLFLLKTHPKKREHVAYMLRPSTLGKDQQEQVIFRKALCMLHRFCSSTIHLPDGSVLDEGSH